MASSSIIFIGSPEKNNLKGAQSLKQLLFVSPDDILFRIFATFVPPVGKNYRKVYVDLQGPLLALLFLTAFVNYGHLSKKNNFVESPTQTVLLYSMLMPVLCFILCKLGHSSITLSETASLIGYALYGHVFTLLISFLCFEERSNFFFFVCLTFFGGLSTLRVALVLLKTIQLPAARLLICASVSTVNILYVIFLHFAYMHRTYVYKGH